MFKQLFNPLKNIDFVQRRNYIFLSLAYMFTLFSYPILRSSTDAFFIQAHGAKNWPWVTLYSVITLSVCIYFFSRLQKKFGVVRIYLATSLFSSIFFFFIAIARKQGWDLFAYPAYIWKECYIVILIHLCLSFFNTNFSYDFAKSFIGPFGAMSSIGGILGGLLTSFLTREIGMFWLVSIGCFVCILSLLFFMKLRDQVQGKECSESEESVSSHHRYPLESIRGVWSYVGSIALVIFITQFFINVINFRFTVAVDDNFADIVSKTVFMGKVYTLINIITFIIYFFLTTLALKNFSLRKNHFIVVGMYLFVFLPLFIFQGHIVMAISGIFIASKAVDYSFFGSIKEMLYYPLSQYQKYGAKYIVDMLWYRLSKGLVSIILIFVQSFRILETLLVFSSLMWLAVVFKIFRLRSRLLKKSTVSTAL